ncbi:MAG TPA: DUF5683 domain-containing protein [Saprospiraceae bacterium]|nr:DUF5683 domain-containing protein [Saprospiraceae bacterium]
MNRWIFTSLVLWMWILKADAQIGPAPNNPLGNQQQIIVADTSTNPNDTLINKNGFFSLFKGKPGRAAFYSLVIPGGGQAYNRKYWKIPIAIGIDVSLAYVLIYNTNQYNIAQNLYLTAVKDKDPLASRYKLQRDGARKGREYSYIYLIIGHLSTVIDAFVDQHLLDFDVSDDLTSNYNRDILVPSISKIGVNIPLNKTYKTTPNPLYPGVASR